MCCAVKDMQVIPGIETVSKTKIRGLFSLLKACGGLGMVSEEGESVQLILGEGIHSFKDLKQRHDLFMNQVLNHLRVALPVEFEAQLLWNWNDSEYVNKKVEEMKELEEVVVDFFLHGKQVSSTSANDFLTMVSLRNDEEDDEDDYNFDNEFGSKFSFQQSFFPEKQQPQVPRPTLPPSRSQQTFSYERIERNFGNTGNSSLQSSYQSERPPQQQPQSARGSPQLVSYGLHQRSNNYSHQSQPRIYPQSNNTHSSNNIHNNITHHNNSKSNTHQNRSSIHISNSSFSSDSLQSSHYWNESQQLLRHHQHFSRGSSSNNRSINNNNNLSSTNINNVSYNSINTANQSFSNVNNLYKKQY
jgi:hypothetical protein